MFERPYGNRSKICKKCRASKHGGKRRNPKLSKVHSTRRNHAKRFSIGTKDIVSWCCSPAEAEQRLIEEFYWDDSRLLSSLEKALAFGKDFFTEEPFKTDDNGQIILSDVTLDIFDRKKLPRLMTNTHWVSALTNRQKHVLDPGIFEDYINDCKMWEEWNRKERANPRQGDLISYIKLVVNK